MPWLERKDFLLDGREINLETSLLERYLALLCTALHHHCTAPQLYISTVNYTLLLYNYSESIEPRHKGQKGGGQKPGN